jgi:hypothetical protein
MKQYPHLSAAFPGRVLPASDRLPPALSFRTIPAKTRSFRPGKTLLRKFLDVLVRSLGAFSV